MIWMSVTALLHFGASHAMAPAQGTCLSQVVECREGHSCHHKWGQGRTAEQTEQMEKATALDNKANTSRKRWAYETCPVCLTLGWHLRLLCGFAAAQGLCKHLVRCDCMQGGYHYWAGPLQNGGIPLLPSSSPVVPDLGVIWPSPLSQFNLAIWKKTPNSPRSEQFFDRLKFWNSPHSPSMHTCSGLPTGPTRPPSWPCLHAGCGWRGPDRPMSLHPLWASRACSQWGLWPPECAQDARGSLRGKGTDRNIRALDSRVAPLPSVQHDSKFHW